MQVDTSTTPAGRRAFFQGERERLDQEIAAASRLVARELDILTAAASGAPDDVAEFNRLEQAHQALPELRRQRARIEHVLQGLASHDHRWRMQRAVEDATAARGEFYDAMRTFREAVQAAQAAGEAALAVARRVDAAALAHGSYLDRLRQQAEGPADPDVSAEQLEPVARELAALEAAGFPIPPHARESMHIVASIMGYLRVPEGSLSTVARFMHESEVLLAGAPTSRRKR